MAWLVLQYIKKLLNKGYKKIITATKKKLNLIDQKSTFNFFKKKKPDFVILAAAKSWRNFSK